MAEDYWTIANQEYRQKQIRANYTYAVGCIHIMGKRLSETHDPQWVKFYEREQAKNWEYLIEAAENYKQEFGTYPEGYMQNG